MRSPPRLEPSGSERSHEPRRRSYTPSKKSNKQEGEEDAAPAERADAAVSAEGLREAVSAGARPDAVLRRRVPAEGAAVVAVEEPSALPEVGAGTAETARRPCALSEEAGSEAAGAACKGRARVITHGAPAKFFSVKRAIVPAAT